MAPRNVLHRLVWGGRLYTDEAWTCSVHIDANEILAQAAEDFKAAIAAWVGRADSQLSGAAKLDFIKFNRLLPFVLPNGKTSMRYALSTTNEHQELAMANGAGTAGPPQLSTALTFRTGISRGRASKGRIFPPSGQPGLGADGRISASDAGFIAASGATLIRELNAVVAGPGTASVVVFSNIGQLVENVQSVAVGRVVDTMRSRRTSLNEEHVVALVNP